MVDIFGEKYAAAPTKFKFHFGEIMLIQELVKHVKGIVDRGGENMGLGHFKEKRRKTKPNQMAQRKRKKITNENALESLDQDNGNSSTFTEAKLKSSHSELKSKLFSLCLENMQAFGVNEKLIMQFGEHMVDLVCKNGAIHGTIECILCINAESQSKKKNAHSVRYYEHQGSNYWVLSNFKKHLEKVHNLVSSSDFRKKRPKSSKETPKRVLKEANDSKKDPLIEVINVPVHISDAANENTPDLTVHFPVGFQVRKHTVNASDWLYTQLSKQIPDMVATNLHTGDDTEIMQFQIANKTHTITVSKILQDGNCLPAAICHQLFHDSIGSTAHRNKIKELRTLVVDHILNPENFPSFEHDLKNRVYEIKSKNEITDMTMECKLLVRHGLSRDRYWCGSETLAVVSKCHRVNILIFNEMGDVYLFDGRDEVHGKTIAIAFRLNSTNEFYHYDSVSDIESNVLYEIVQTISKK